MRNFYSLLIFTLVFTSSRSLNSNKGACSISTISIPIGSSYPVMIYNARVENENWQLTVLEKEHAEKYEVEGSLFYSDKKTGESWFANRNVDDEQYESMRDAFSVCRTLNTDNKTTKIYEKSRLYSKFRTSTVPQNLALRINKKEEEENLNSQTQMTTSFLQMRMKQSDDDFSGYSPSDDLNEDTLKEDIKDMDSSSPIDNTTSEEEEMEKELDELDIDKVFDQAAEQAKELNNDAYNDNKELERQLDRDNTNSHPSSDLILD